MQTDNDSIGYVSHVTDLPQSVLRYWETVFPQFCPHKTPGGTRRYTQADIDLVKQIKTLLYDRKFTIKGAKTFLESGQTLTVTAKDDSLRNYIVSELESILKEMDEINI